MLSRKKFYKLYESLNDLTGIYGDLVEITKTFEKELGADDIATTGLLEAVAKVNELILRYNPSADELDTVQAQDQGLQDLQGFDNTPIQDAQSQDTQSQNAQSQNAQSQNAQSQNAQSQNAQSQNAQQTQDNLESQVQDQL